MINEGGEPERPEGRRQKLQISTHICNRKSRSLPTAGEPCLRQASLTPVRKTRDRVPFDMRSLRQDTQDRQGRRDDNRL